ncbi:MAG: hypothetical protein IT372_04025 [Polyangiaceae bacterium]|nr:hypothetical protein [Polyangiaceae bacterium]
MRIRDALDLPEITALDEFITRLDDSADRVRRNLELFVLPADVQTKLDATLHDLGERAAQGRDTGRFIYGTFGSGKSHLLTVVGKMLERDETVYEVGDPGLRALRARNPWLDRHRTLVVRLNMMGKSSLVSALYHAFNGALPAAVPKLQFTNEQQVFDLIERDAQRYYGGLDGLIARLVQDQAIAAPGFYHRNRHGDLDQQIDLAARLLTWRDHDGKTVLPEDLWVPAEEGFTRIARHAKAHGYTAIAWLVDELVIWLRGKARDEYIQQINDLSALVDHDGKASRATPFLVLVGVQQDIIDTCPEDLSEKGFREQLGFVSDRFKPFLMLEDQDLYEVAARRVLRPRPEAAAAFGAAVDATFRKSTEAIKALSGDLDPALVRRLYPFHPALLRALVDVTQALSRSRTAIAALYGLLKKYPDLEVGSFLPVGALFEILFTVDNVESVRKRQQSALAQRFVAAYDAYERLGGKVDDAVRSVPGARPEELHQLVRTVLLCQLSERPYFPSGQSLRERVTASTLLRLNMSDVKAMTERTGVSKVVSLFRTLAANDAAVQVTGEATDPLITIKTERVDIEQVLARARADVVHADRFAYCRKLVDAELGLGLGTATKTTMTLTWRGTKRKGLLHLANVRTLSYAGQENDFDPGPNELLILVDYPFDEQPGCSRQDDIAAAQKARARKRQWTVAWLPQHFTDTEQKALTNAAAIERIRSARRHYVDDHYSAREAQAIAGALEAFFSSQEEILKVAVRRLYVEEGAVEGCSDLLDNLSVVGRDRSKIAEGLATAILDARYPQHPHFKRRVQVRELQRLAEWVVEAAQTGQPKDLKSTDMDIVEGFGVPLEIVYQGESSISRRTDGRFLSAIHGWIAGEPGRFKASSLREKLSAGGKDGFGFTEEVVRFFLYYLLQVEGYEAQVRGVGQTIDGLDGLPADFELVKADVVDAPTWDRARSAARAVLGVEGRADLPSPPEQSKLSRDVGAAARKMKQVVDEFQASLKRTLAWADVAASTSERVASVGRFAELLVSLADTQGHADRMRLLAALDKDPAGKRYADLRKELPEEQAALRAIEGQQRAFKHVEKHGTEAQRKAIVAALQNLLRDPVERRLALVAGDWAAQADRTFGEMLEHQPQPDGRKKSSSRPPQAGPEPTGSSEAGKAAPTPTEKGIAKQRRGVARKALRENVLSALQEALEGLEGERFDLELTLRPTDRNGGGGTA